MDTETAEIVRWLRGRAILEEVSLTKNVLTKAADTIERLQKDNDAGRELMRQAWHVFNGIRAADGAPYGYTHEWWDGITEAFNDLLGDDTVPWMTGAAQALVNPLIKESQDEQDARAKLLAEVEQWRVKSREIEETHQKTFDDLAAARAEVERLKGELAEASGQVEWLDKSNNLLRTQIEGVK